MPRVLALKQDANANDIRTQRTRILNVQNVQNFGAIFPTCAWFSSYSIFVDTYNSVLCYQIHQQSFPPQSAKTPLMRNMKTKQLWEGRHALLTAAMLVAIPFYLFWTYLDDEPYMDEIFHVKQTQAYCAGNWTSWDPKITTFPGLYFIAIGYRAVALLVAGTIHGRPEQKDTVSGQPFCNARFLRTVNLVFALGIAHVSVRISRTLHPAATPRQLLLRATLVLLHPVLFFFFFLFYTDPAAVYFVLLTYHFTLASRPKSAAAAAAAAIFCRQTGAVWAVFCAGAGALQQIRSAPSGAGCAGGVGEEPLRRELWRAVRLGLLGPLRGEVLRRAAPLAAVAAAFAAFVVANGGVAVGDRPAAGPPPPPPSLTYDTHARMY